MPAILEFAQLGKMYGTDRRHLLAAATASVREREDIAVLGASGQGKSTLLRLLARLEAPDSGELRLHGSPAASWHPRDWRKAVTYVAQQAVMLPGTVMENLQTAGRLHRIPFDAGLASELMCSAGLGELDPGRPAAGLSGGEKQRVALIRSLLLHPEVLLLDEVTASLDQTSAQAVERLLEDWRRREGTALVRVTHNLEQVRRCCGRVWFLAEGALADYERMEDFFAAPATEAAGAYLRPQAAGVSSP